MDEVVCMYDIDGLYVNVVSPFPGVVPDPNDALSGYDLWLDDVLLNTHETFVRCPTREEARELLVQRGYLKGR